MRIVVLTKSVPDTTGQERLGPDGRVDRAGLPAVVNGNDEYAVEAALKLVEASPGGGDVTLLSMGPANASDTLRKALAMGATRAVLVTDQALEGSCALPTIRVLAAALRDLEYDLVLAGVDTSDGAVESGPLASPPSSASPTCPTRRRSNLGTAGSASAASPRPATTSSRPRCRR